MKYLMRSLLALALLFSVPAYADTKVSISDLKSPGSIASGDLFPCLQGSDTEASKCDAARISTFVLGNGFTSFTGPTTSSKVFTLPNASATILTDNALVTAAQGGTGNGFFAVTGPSSSTKTFTFPNASTTVLTTNALVTYAQGGTGQASYTDGQVLIGNTSTGGLSKATLTAGSNVTITNGNGTITIASSGSGSSPLTTKADLFTHSTVDARLPVGADGTFLMADSGQTTGLSWGSPSGSGTVNSGTSGRLTYYASTGTAVSGNANATISSGALTLGQTGSVAGSVVLSGSTSGAITIQPQAAAGTYNWNPPTTAGTSGQFEVSGGGGSNPHTWRTLTSAAAEAAIASTVTWTGTSAPSGTSNLRYQWQQVGSMVTLVVRLEYSVAGSGNTAVTIEIPSDAPAPAEFTGVANTEVMSQGFCREYTNMTGTGNATACYMQKNSSSATGYYLVMNGFPSSAALAALGTFVYPAASNL